MMKSKTFVVVLSLFAVLGVAGASTYTTADLDRTVNVDVATDDSSVVQFNSGVGTNIQDGELMFNADGNTLNNNGVFTFGDTDNPVDTNAVEVVNSDLENRTGTINVDYTGADNTDGNVNVIVYEADGSLAGETNNGNVTATFDDRVYIVTEVETGEEETLDGEIEFTTELN